MTAEERAHKKVKRLIEEHTPEPLPTEVNKELEKIMDAQGKKQGFETLPYK